MAWGCWCAEQPGGGSGKVLHSVDVKHPHAAVLHFEQSRFFQYLQGLIGPLARHAREQADLLLGQLQECGSVRIQQRVEQLRERARYACVGFEQAVFRNQPPPG